MLLSVIITFEKRFIFGEIDSKNIEVPPPQGMLKLEKHRLSSVSQNTILDESLMDEKNRSSTPINDEGANHLI